MCCSQRDTEDDQRKSKAEMARLAEKDFHTNGECWKRYAARRSRFYTLKVCRISMFGIGLFNGGSQPVA